MSNQSDGPYAALFRQYIQRSTQATLAAVQSAGPALPAEQREQSLHTLDFALELPEAWPDARELLLVLAPKLDQAGMRQDTIPFLQRGIEQCQAAGDLAGQAGMELQLGSLLSAMGQMDEARALFTASAARYEALGDRHNQARALNSWAQLDRLQQRSDSAARLVQQAMSLAPPDDSETTNSQFILGALAVDRRDWAEALDYFEQALAGWRRHGNPVMVARSLTNLGTAQRGAGRYDEAIASFTQAMALMDELDDPVNQAITRMNLGNLYWATGQPQQAMAHFVQAEPVFRQAQDQQWLARINTNMGVVHLQLGHWEQADAALTTAVDLNRAIGDRRAAANALDSLGELYLRQGQPAAAMACLAQAMTELGDLAGKPGYAEPGRRDPRAYRRGAARTNVASTAGTAHPHSLRPEQPRPQRWARTRRCWLEPPTAAQYTRPESIDAKTVNASR